MAAPASRRPSRRMWLGPVDSPWKIQLDGVNVLKDVSIPAELHMSSCQWVRGKKKKKDVCVRMLTEAPLLLFQVIG